MGSLLGKTWRMKVLSAPSIDIFNPQAPCYICCFWHSKLLVAAYTLRNTGKTAVVSSSKDGRLAALVTRNWGHQTIYGSSTRGGFSATRQCVRSLKDGRSIAITPDGPRGPKEIVKNGVAQISILSGVPVIPIKISADRAWYLRSWDRFMIPAPFAKVTMTVGEPIYPPMHSQDIDSMEHFIQQIQSKLS